MDGGRMQHHTDDARASHACPAWCRRTHQAGAHPDDQHHASRPRHAVVLTGSPMLDPDDLATPSPVVGRLVRRTHSDLTWVEVLSEEGRDLRLVVTVDSARRLITLLQELLAADDG
jgi:hypothetical protein